MSGDCVRGGSWHFPVEGVHRLRRVLWRVLLVLVIVGQRRRMTFGDRLPRLVAMAMLLMSTMIVARLDGAIIVLIHVADTFGQLVQVKTVSR